MSSPSHILVTFCAFLCHFLVLLFFWVRYLSLFGFFQPQPILDVCSYVFSFILVSLICHLNLHSTVGKYFSGNLPRGSQIHVSRAGWELVAASVFFLSHQHWGLSVVYYLTPLLFRIPSALEIKGYVYSPKGICIILKSCLLICPSPGFVCRLNLCPLITVSACFYFHLQIHY